MFGEHMEDLLQHTTEPEPEEPPRELTVEEALAIAIQLHRDGRFEEANVVYSQILLVDPANARALHFSGVLAHQLGRSTDALALIARSLSLVPDVADWHSNLGIVLQESGQLDGAIDAYQRAIALDPNHANAHSNLGVLLRAKGQPEEAEHAYRTAIRLNPNHIDAYTNLGILLYGVKRREEAVACFCKVITLRPKHPEAWRLPIAHSVSSTRRFEFTKSGSRKAPMIRSPGICCRRAAAVRLRNVRRTRSCKFRSTVSPPVSKPSWRSCRIAHRRSSARCWKTPACLHRRASMCSTWAAAQGYAVR
jgi:Flp pilus assembly protein TadD